MEFDLFPFGPQCPLLSAPLPSPCSLLIFLSFVHLFIFDWCFIRKGGIHSGIFTQARSVIVLNSFHTSAKYQNH